MNVDRGYFFDHVARPAFHRAADTASEDRTDQTTVTQVDTRDGVRCLVTVTFKTDPEGATA